LEKGLPFGDAVDLPFVYNAVTDLGLPDPASWEELEDFIIQQWSPTLYLRRSKRADTFGSFTLGSANKTHHARGAGRDAGSTSSLGRCHEARSVFQVAMRW